MPSSPKSFTQILQNALNPSKRSQYLKQIFLHLDLHPEDALTFWTYDKMKVLVVQTLIAPFVCIEENGVTVQILSWELKGLNITESCNGLDLNQNTLNNSLNQKTFQDTITILNILQIIVTNPVIKQDFIDLQLPFYIYPYLNRPSTPFIDKKYVESLTIASLGVFGQILNDKTALNYLMSTEMVPFCLKLMDVGSDTAKKIAIYIFYTLISSDEGLEYATQTFERFVAISVILNSMVQQIIDEAIEANGGSHYRLNSKMNKNLSNIVEPLSPNKEPSAHPLLHPILDCYFRLATKPNVRLSFGAKMPDGLKSKHIRNGTNSSVIERIKEFERLCAGNNNSK